MAQNIYDNPAFFAGYSQLPRQVLGLDGAPEWPAIRALLPEVREKRVVDLGCGFGWASRWMREQGAVSVLGLDLSQNMIDRARRDTDDAAIEYRIADLDTLQLPPAAFDLAYSALTFHYVEDFSRLVRTIAQSLNADGHLTWPVNGYALEGQRRTDWFAKGVLKYHRTLATTLNTLIEAGLRINRVEEFAPSPEQVAALPNLAEELERPMMLLVSAQR